MVKLNIISTQTACFLPTLLKYFCQLCLDEGPNKVDVDHMATAGIDLNYFIQLVLPACFVFPQQQNGNVDDICLSSCSLGWKNHFSFSKVCQSSS